MEKKKVILDTDIGDEMDDAFALALALTSPELEVIGITTAHGATDKRARIVRRFLHEMRMDPIPVAVGVKTSNASPVQYPWAERFSVGDSSEPRAIDFYIEKLTQHPGQITLIAHAPLTNISAVINRDAAAFKKVKEVIVMGGSIAYGYDDLGYTEPTGPAAEYNIKTDIAAARKVFASGVPITMVGLDATTRLALDEVKRRALFKRSTPLTNSLALLYHLRGETTPTLYDPMAVAMVIDPGFCQVRPMYIVIDDEGITRTVSDKSANALVCFQPQVDRFFQVLLSRLLHKNLHRLHQGAFHNL
ncbi:MAG: nucleoside hydrolase [Acidobacteria bacterium]|nr:nucleoside hydrolase [Acidobacteriota bacterium]